MDNELKFVKIPRTLLGEGYKNMSAEAKWLYVLMRNDFLERNIAPRCDDNGNYYIYFTIEKIMYMLNVGNKQAIKIKKELIKYNLIDEKRQGLGKPNKIFVNLEV